MGEKDGEGGLEWKDGEGGLEWKDRTGGWEWKAGEGEMDWSNGVGGRKGGKEVREGGVMVICRERLR